MPDELTTTSDPISTDVSVPASEPAREPQPTSTPTDVASPDASSAQAPSLWDRMFRNRGASRSAEPAATDPTADSTSPSGTGAVPPQPNAATVPTFDSPEQFQAYLRAENQRYADTRDHLREVQTRTERISGLEAGIREAHERGDVFSVDELTGQLADLKSGVEREHSEAEQHAAVIGRVVSSLEQATTMPLLAALPKGIADDILAQHDKGIADKRFDGVTGRAFVTAEALKALEKHWTDEGERKARSNPAVRQQIRNDLHLTTAEPEHFVGTAAGEKSNMNTFIRTSLGRE